MELTIFGKPLADITYQDVIDFCGLQKREGINLDYKRDLSSSKPLLKTMAAFANTRGGYIIVGVEDEDDKPKLPVTGMPYTESLSLTITNMLVDNLYPYFAPQIHICSPVEGKTFIILHIPESPEAPHWLFNRTELYIRRGDRSSSGSWERYATEQEWEFLRSKRQKSIDLRDYAIRQLDQVFIKENLADLRAHQPPLHDIRVQWDGLLQVKISPLFPSAPLAEVSTLHDLLMSRTIGNIHNGLFPHSAEKRVFQFGAYEYVANRDERSPGVSSFTALSTFGVLAAYERILMSRKGGPSIFASHVIELVEVCLRYMSAIYGELGYNGNLHIEVNFKGPGGVLLELPPNYWGHDDLANLLGEFGYTNELETALLAEKATRYDILIDMTKEFLHSFGTTIDPSSVLDVLLADSREYGDFVNSRQTN